ncbi:MAG: L,D-transpeptidase family protein [Actinomycetota bacterium]|nr:L,D-transpeptidase family protein [Actinomycetota bacterium]
MTSHLARLVLNVLAVLTLLLSAGGALGVWSTGAPATGGNVPAAGGGPAATPQPRESLRPAVARLPQRVSEGPNAPFPSREPGSTSGPGAPAPKPQGAAPEPGTALPSSSGDGRRVVFDMSAQRVWLVGPAGNVQRTYLVSGSRTSNLGAGRYEVYSRSRHAVSYTYEETMQYMVRFAYGEHAAIGFHDIPRDQQGDPVQTRAQLGQRLSAGCIRQARPDARALWRFADVGTEVVVVR